MVRTLRTRRGESVILTSDDSRYPPVLSPEAAEILGDILSLACHAWREEPRPDARWLEREIQGRLADVGAAWMLEAERDG